MLSVKIRDLIENGDMDCADCPCKDKCGEDYQECSDNENEFDEKYGDIEIEIKRKITLNEVLSLIGYFDIVIRRAFCDPSSKEDESDDWWHYYKGKCSDVPKDFKYMNASVLFIHPVWGKDGNAQPILDIAIGDDY